jgi:hypothetical protein
MLHEGESEDKHFGLKKPVRPHLNCFPSLREEGVSGSVHRNEKRRNGDWRRGKGRKKEEGKETHTAMVIMKLQAQSITCQSVYRRKTKGAEERKADLPVTPMSLLDPGDILPSRTAPA